MDQSTTTPIPGTAHLPAAGHLARQVACVSYRWAHLSRNAGYDRLPEMLGVPVATPTPPTVPFIRRMAQPLVALRRRLGSTQLDRYYTQPFFQQEQELIRASGHESYSLYHFLYGESAFRTFKKARPGKKVVASFHQPPSIMEPNIRQPERFSDLDAAIIMGENQRAYFEQYLPATRIHRIRHGIDTTVFRPANERTSLKRLLFVGVWLRDFITARRVMEHLRTIDKEIRLDVVTLPKCKAHFIGLDNVRVHCGISELELIGMYQRSALLFLPLKDGTFNNSLGEAIGCGLPVISTDVGGIRDYVDDTCATLLPLGGVDAYIETIRSLLSDREARVRMSTAARLRAEQLDWSRVTEPVATVYQNILSGS